MAGKHAQAFEAELLEEFERRGFSIHGFVDGGFNLVNGVSGQKLSVETATQYKKYMEGTEISKIVDGMLGGSSEKKILAILPIVKDRSFLKAWIDSVRKDKKEPKESELPLIAAIPDYDFLVYYVFAEGERSSFLTRGDLASLGMDEKGLLNASIENLEGVLRKMAEGGKMHVKKQDEWAWTLTIPSGLAPSFVLVANRFIDFVRKSTGLKYERFYLFTISAEEVLICDPNVHLSMLPAIKRMVEIKQETLKGNAAVRLPAFIITKEGYSPFNMS